MKNYFEEFADELESMDDALHTFIRFNCGGLDCSNCPFGRVYGVVHPIMIQPPNEDNVQYETNCMIMWFKKWYEWNMKQLHNKYDSKVGDPDGSKES